MAARSNKIRVGMVRADKRALWYGAILDEIVPETYAALDPLGYHHLTYYSCVALTHKRAEGFELARIWDPDGAKARQLQEAFGGRPRVCETLEEASDDVDLVFIANEASDGSDHLRLATPGLHKGVPTFIDRPLSHSVEEAKALIRLARRTKAPLLSCSHLRLLPHAERFKRRLDELEPLERGSVQGHGPNPGDVADGIELGLYLFGDDFGGRVEEVHSMGDRPLETLLFGLANLKTGRQAQVMVVNSTMGGERHAFHATASSNLRQIYLDDLELFVQPEGGLGVANALREMVHSGKPPLPYPEMLLAVAVAEAGRQAHNTGRGVKISELGK